MAKRTTHRSSAGKKLYAVRDKSGQFKDIQSYERSHAMDMRTTSAAEAATESKGKKKAAKKKVAKKKAAKKKVAKKKVARKKAAKKK